MTNKEYVTDNTFVNAIEESGIDVDVVDRSGHTSTILVEPKQPIKKVIMDSVESEQEPQTKFVPEKTKQLEVNTNRMVGGRNAPCPCSSGKKYKNCCLQ